MMKFDEASSFSENPSNNSKTIIVIGSVGFDCSVLMDEIPGIGETN